MPYIFQADIYCDDCGKDICERIRKEYKERGEKFPRGKFADETRYDSSEYPKECYGSDEADSPQHCGSHGDCINPYVGKDGTKYGAFLENSLTSEGERYVLEKYADDPSEITEMWMDYYGLGEKCDKCDRRVDELCDGMCEMCWNDENEPQDSDYTSDDHLTWYQYGKPVLELGEDDDYKHRLREHMEKNKFYPNAWWISDHGNARSINLYGPESQAN